MSQTESADQELPSEQELYELLPLLADFRFHLRSFLSYSEQRAEALGITAQQYQMMQVVGNSGEAGCSISHLASRLLLRHNSVVELVDRAERSGLVQRAVDQADLRRSLLQLTEHGRKLLLQLVGEHVHFLLKEGETLQHALHEFLRVAAAERLDDHG